MTRLRRRRSVLAAVMAAAVALLAGSQAITSPRALADAPAASSPSAGCGPVSCVYSRTGQSLFKVPLGVTLLQVDVIGAGITATSNRTAAAHHPALRPGEAVEVQGNLALAPNVSTLEVVVGGKDTLEGTTSEIMTSTDSTPQVLVAADGVPVPTVAKNGKSAKGAASSKSATSSKSAKTTKSGKSAASSKQAKAKGHKKATHTSTAANRLITTPTRIPVGGTVVPATSPARVVISWRAPWQAPRVVSSRTPVLTAGTPDTFVVRAVAATVPTITELGSLPLGLSFKDQGNGTAAIAGVPVVDGVYPVEVTVTAGADTPVTQHLELTVRGGLIRLGAADQRGKPPEPIAVLADV